jgi:hypothetical protein
MGQAKRRFEDVNALGGELIGDAAQERVIFPALQLGQETRAAQIGTEVAKQPDFSDATRHHRLGHPGALKRPNNVAQLADVNPHDIISDAFNRLIGLTAMCDGEDGVAFALCLFGKNQRKLSVARDQA